MYTIQNYLCASSLEEAYALLKKSRRNKILAGGLWLRMTRISIGTAIDLSGLDLARIEDRPEEVVIGAMVSLRQLETDPCLQTLFGGVLPVSVSSIVGVQFRNSATIGASVYSRYGFSDPITALLALDAQVELFDAGIMPLAAFLQAKLPRDILVRIRIPKDGRRAAYETCRASATDFGQLNVCMSVTPENRWAVSIGARPAAAVRVPAAEACLAQGDLAGAEAAVQEIAYGSNMRAGAAYRKAIAAVLVRRAFHRLQEGQA